MMRILIVDDEQKSRSTLARLLEKYIDGVEVIGEAEDADSAEQQIHELRPDLVLLDVEMPRASGFELLGRFSEPDFGIIFCTAHDHYAIPAIRAAAIDYLLKPVKIQELGAAIETARRLRRQQSTQQVQVETLLQRIQQPEKKHKIAVPDLRGINFLEVGQILFLKADNNYTELHLLDGSRMTSSRTLKEYDEMLRGEGFFRAGKSHVINLAYVKRYVRGSGGYVIMHGDLELEVSRRRKDELLQLLMDR
jgi:two-component system LytT family response regulator